MQPSANTSVRSGHRKNAATRLQCCLRLSPLLSVCVCVWVCVSLTEVRGSYTHTEQSSKQRSGWSATFGCICIKSGGAVKASEWVYFCFECNRWTIIISASFMHSLWSFTLKLALPGLFCSGALSVSPVEPGEEGPALKGVLTGNQQILYSKAFKFTTENNIWHWKQRTEKKTKNRDIGSETLLEIVFHWSWNNYWHQKNKSTAHFVFFWARWHRAMSSFLIWYFSTQIN